jgi:toxin ParE1/3/4
MAHRIVWSRRALQDLEAIVNYIAADSEVSASTFVKKIVGQTKTLAQFPRAGRRVPEFDDEDVRELVVHSYSVYQLQDNRVVIAAVIHGKRILQ